MKKFADVDAIVDHTQQSRIVQHDLVDPRHGSVKAVEPYQNVFLQRQYTDRRQRVVVPVLIGAQLARAECPADDRSSGGNKAAGRNRDGAAAQLSLGLAGSIDHAADDYAVTERATAR
jgi:hypothetical protein